MKTAHDHYNKIKCEVSWKDAPRKKSLAQIQNIGLLAIIYYIPMIGIQVDTYKITGYSEVPTYKITSDSD